MSPYMDAEPMEPIPPGHCEGETPLMDETYGSLEEYERANESRTWSASHPADLPPLSAIHAMTDNEQRAAVNDFTQDDPPPYDDEGPTGIAAFRSGRYR